MSSDQKNLTIYFADISGSSQIYQTLGDEEAVRQVTAAIETMSRYVVSSGGSVLRTIGDEVLAIFDSPEPAFECASQTQHHFESSALGVSIGFHHGSAIAHAGDIYGTAVNLAARLVSLASSGEVVTSQGTIDAVNQQPVNVQQDTPTFVPYESETLATISPKGIDSPVVVHRVNWSRAQMTRIATRISESESSDGSVAVKIRLTYAHSILEVARGRISVGRADTCDLQIANDMASRRHGVVEVRDNKVWYQDTSSNGTFYLQQGMAPIRIMRESVILVGSGRLGMGASPDVDAKAAVDYVVDQVGEAGGSAGGSSL